MTLGRASWLMAAMIGLSRLTGFGRIVLTSNLYGRNAVTDAYNAAFNVPDTISILIAGGALATGFVPVFTQYLARGEEDAARRTFRAMLTLLGAAFGALTLLLFALTFSSVGVAFARTQVQPDKVELYFYLLRVLLAAQFFFVLGGLFTGTLNALRLFWFAALQPVVFNVGIIVFGLLLPRFGMGIESQAWGALAGALIGSIFIQIPAVKRSGLSLAPLWDTRDEGVQRVLKSLLPIVFGLASGQIIALNLPRFLAGGLAEGGITALDNANRLMQLPLAILASGPAIALFPTLSLLNAEGKTDEARTQLAAALRRTVVLMTLAAVLLAALRFPLIHFLLEHGRFNRSDTLNTTPVLWCYALCLVGLGAQQILSRGFYARGETRLPVVIGVLAMMLFGASGALLVYVLPADAWLPSGAPRLALAAALACTFMGIALFVALRRALGGWDDGATRRTLWKSALAAIPTYITAQIASDWSIAFIAAQGMDDLLTPSWVKFAARGAALGIGALCGVVAFLLVARALRLKVR